MARRGWEERGRGEMEEGGRGGGGCGAGGVAPHDHEASRMGMISCKDELFVHEQTWTKDREAA